MPVQKWSAMMDKSKEAETKKFVPLEANTYNFIIKDQPKVTEGKVNKNGEEYTQIGAKLTVESGPRANGTIFNNFNINSHSANGLQMFFDQMAVLGLGADFFASEPSIEQVASALVGRRFTAEVYKNGEYMNVRGIKPPTGPAPSGNPTPTPSTPAPAATPTPQAAPAPAPQTYAAPQAEAPAAPVDPWANTQAQPPAPDNSGPWANTQAPPPPPPAV